MSHSKNQDEILLQFARYHGLTRDHMLEDPVDIAHFLPLRVDDDWSVTNGEYKNIFPVGVSIPSEKLSLDAETRTLLAEVLRPDTDRVVSVFDEIPANRRRTAKGLKLELPLLRSDHDLDVLTAKRKQHPKALGKLEFELLPVDEEADEGLSWPHRYLSLPQEYDQLCSNEKLAMTREDAMWLRNQLAVEDCHEAIEEITATELKRRRRPEPLTPPLSSTRFWEDARSLPSSPSISALPVMSEHTSPTVHLQKAVEAELMQRDAVGLCRTGKELDSDDIAAFFTPSQSEAARSSSPARLIVDRYRLEEPLTPITRLQPGNQTAVSDPSSDMITKFQAHLNADGIDEEPDINLYELFGDAFRHSVEHVEARLQNEKLIEADSAKRLPVPNLDDCAPTPPWMAADREAHQRADAADLMAVLKEIKLHKLSVSFERELRWNPLPPHAGQLPSEDAIDYPGHLEDFIETLSIEDVVNHNNLSWKPDGLRILDDHDSDDDELEPATFASPDHLGGLLFRRKQEMTVERSELKIPSVASERPALAAGSRITRAIVPVIINTPAVSTAGFTKGRRQQAKSEIVPDFFSATDELTQFMDLQTGHLQKKRKTEQPSAAAAVPQATTALPPLPATVAISSSAPPAKPPQALPETPRPDLPIPNPSTTIHLIISTTFLTTHRPIINILTTLSNINLIERDFAGLERTKFSTTPSKSAANVAPDVLISPATALILTTMQKVAQKPLPGQGGMSMSPLRRRVVEVSKTCERIIVLVTTSTTQDERDIQALAEFISFASALDGGVEVLTLADGSDQDVARQILALVAMEDRSASVQEKYDILPDETTWEVFLRRAGMNAFAAQVVLCALKAPDDGACGAAVVYDDTGQGGMVEDWRDGVGSVYGSESTCTGGWVDKGARQQNRVYGLPAFVLMSAEERRQRFATLLGGTRVLDRVNKVLDGSWK